MDVPKFHRRCRDFARRDGSYRQGPRIQAPFRPLRPWKRTVPSRKPNVTYTSAPDAGDSWQAENASSQEDIGNYKGDPTTTSSSEWTQYRNQMDSKRWEAANGQNATADSLYDPHGNDWYVCAIYGSGASSYADFGIYCACFGPAIHPDGRPYFPRYGRWLTPDSPLSQNPLDPNDLNAYGYDGGDPINNADAGTGDPTKPPLPGTDQLQRALDWLRDQLNAVTCSSFGCFAVNAGLGFTEGLGYGLAGGWRRH